MLAILLAQVRGEKVSGEPLEMGDLIWRSSAQLDPLPPTLPFLHLPTPLCPLSPSTPISPSSSADWGSAGKDSWVLAGPPFINSVDCYTIEAVECKFCYHLDPIGSGDKGTTE